eukprot:2289035-Rhodomonas_salina.1
MIYALGAAACGRSILRKRLSVASCFTCAAAGPCSGNERLHRCRLPLSRWGLEPNLEPFLHATCSNVET